MIMNQSNLEHLCVALVIQAIVWLLTGDMWLGAALASGIYIGREHAQREYEIDDPIRLVGYEALDVWRWSKDAILDLVMPVVAVLRMRRPQPARYERVSRTVVAQREFTGARPILQKQDEDDTRQHRLDPEPAPMPLKETHAPRDADSRQIDYNDSIRSTYFSNDELRACGSNPYGKS